jgi:hypothetical protein
MLTGWQLLQRLKFFTLGICGFNFSDLSYHHELSCRRGLNTHNDVMILSDTPFLLTQVDFCQEFKTLCQSLKYSSLHLSAVKVAYVILILIETLAVASFSPVRTFVIY